LDVAPTLNLLGVLYIQTKEWAKAEQALERAAGIFNHSPETMTMDRFKILFAMGALWSRQREWARAEKEFVAAIAIADREEHIDPATLRSLFASYAWVLRKDHRPVEARAVEARAATLGSGLNAVVDMRELAAGSKPSKK
jgi:uncharacterized protein HemY